MARVKGAMMTRKRRKKVLKLAKGYWGAKSRHFKMAKQAVMKSGNYAFIGRKQRKRDFRRLWITRISAACRMNDINYSTFMNGLKKAGVTLNRKMLSEIAIADPAGFTRAPDCCATTRWTTTASCGRRRVMRKRTRVPDTLSDTLVYLLAEPADRPPALYFPSSKEWITTPERSLGSNHVVLGGMMLPVSAMSISCFIETG